MHESKVFISKALVETSSIFSSMNCAIKSNAKIVSKLDALKKIWNLIILYLPRNVLPKD